MLRNHLTDALDLPDVLAQLVFEYADDLPALIGALFDVSFAGVPQRMALKSITFACSGWCVSWLTDVSNLFTLLFVPSMPMYFHRCENCVRLFCVPSDLKREVSTRKRNPSFIEMLRVPFFRPVASPSAVFD